MEGRKYFDSSERRSSFGSKSSSSEPLNATECGAGDQSSPTKGAFRIRSALKSGTTYHEQHNFQQSAGDTGRTTESTRTSFLQSILGEESSKKETILKNVSLNLPQPTHGILKHNKFDSKDGDHIETKSILKDPSIIDIPRRSSLQVTIDTSNEPSSTKGILKRKYSYDNNITKLANFTSDLKEYSSSEQCLNNANSELGKTKPSILKNRSMDENSASYYDDMDSQAPRPILKNNNRSASIPNSDQFSDNNDLLKSCFRKQTVSLEEPLSSAKSNGSIAQKIAALKINGESEWKKRVPPKKISPEISPPSVQDNAFSENTISPEKTGKSILAERLKQLNEAQNRALPKQISCEEIVAKSLDQISKADDSPISSSQEKSTSSQKSILAARLQQLNAAQETWKKRIPTEKEDAKKYTVEGKLKRDGKRNNYENSNGSNDKLPQKSKEFESINQCNEDSNEETGFKRSFSLRLNSTSSKKVSPDFVKSANILKSSLNAKQNSNNAYTEVEVFENDNETFSTFFESVKYLEGDDAGKNVVLEEDSFQSILIEDNSHLLRDNSMQQRRNIRMARKHGGSKNPVKSLALRIQGGDEQLQQSYTDLSPEEREKQAKRLHIQQQLNVNPSGNQKLLSSEALAGLASKEDFSAVKLKKAEEVPVVEYTLPILLQIKGKRFVQTRLVEPSFHSLNAGDCFVLITAEKLYHYSGEYSNRIERSKLSDVVKHISQNRDLGFIGKEIIRLDGSDSNLQCKKDWSDFLKILNADVKTNCKVCDNDLGDEFDEAYETKVIGKNRVFVEENGELCIIEELSYCQPKYAYLREDTVLVFDFINEVYIWCGSRADSEAKKNSYELAEKYYSGENGRNKLANWCLLKRIVQNMEPIIFIEKFHDWPQPVELKSSEVDGIKLKVGSNPLFDTSWLKTYESKRSYCYEFDECNVYAMRRAVHESNLQEHNLHLEGFDLQRGGDNLIQEYKDGLKREYKIETKELQCWRVSDFSKTDLQITGHFYSSESYVIRWKYVVSSIGRVLKGVSQQNRHCTGRERFVYFFWHGKHSKSTEQGASALMTIEMDKEKGPQVRVLQEQEPPGFMALFNGEMFTHSKEKIFKESDRFMYVVLGNVECEGQFVEVKFTSSSLRSKGVFLVIDRKTNQTFLWIGSESSQLHQNIGHKGFENVQRNFRQWNLPRSPLTLITIREGEESPLFLNCLEISTKNELRDNYYCTLNDKARKNEPVQVFKFSSLSGNFKAIPVFSPTLRIGVQDPFPVVQNVLYNLEIQPALFMICVGETELYLWQGWWPKLDEDNENYATGSGAYRWAAERRAAIETCLKYSKASGYIVHAGKEPPEFISLFPYWTPVEELDGLNLSFGENESQNVKIPVEEELKKLSKRKYSLKELKERPEGVDYTKLEDYLYDEEFSELLKMTRSDFAKLPGWKKTELKKAVNLF